jgi:hypothetical protein
MFHGLEPEPGTIHLGILRPLFGGKFFEFVRQFHPACPRHLPQRSDQLLGVFDIELLGGILDRGVGIGRPQSGSPQAFPANRNV